MAKYPSTVFASWGEIDTSSRYIENKLKLTYALFLAQNTITVDTKDFKVSISTISIKCNEKPSYEVK